MEYLFPASISDEQEKFPFISAKRPYRKNKPENLPYISSVFAKIGIQAKINGKFSSLF